MHDGSTKKYKIEDLPGFFNGISEKTSEVFSDRVIKISTICSKNIDNKKQEFSFNLKLLKEDQHDAVISKNEKDQHDAVRIKIRSLIEFFKMCLGERKSFIYSISVSKKDKGLIKKYEDFIKEYEALIKKYEELIKKYKVSEEDKKLIKKYKISEEDKKLTEKYIELIKKYKISEEDKELIEKYIKHDITICQFIKCIPVAAISRVITIKLQANVRYINPDNLDEIVLFLDKKLHSAAETHYSQSQAQQNTTNNEHIVPTNNSSDGTLTETVAPLLPHTNHFIQPTIAPANEEALTYTQFNASILHKIRDTALVILGLKGAKAEEHTINMYIMQAENDARICLLDVGCVDLQEGTLDKIFTDTVREYVTQYENVVKKEAKKHAKDLVERVFTDIFDSVFDIVYLQDKIKEPNEKKLELLKKLGATDTAPGDEKYFQTAVSNKYKELHNLMWPTQPEPDHSLKSPLRNIFSSKDTYFYLFAITTSTSALCLLHFTALGKSVMSEESTGLILNTALLILIAMCIISLAYVAYSEYTVESVEQVGTSNSKKLDV